MQARSPQSTFGEKEGHQITKRAFIKQPSAEEKLVEEEEASLDTQAITGKDERKIATLAYALYEQRGREDGYDLDDWLEAEQRIVSRGEGRGF
jgi:hypothetical protein